VRLSNAFRWRQSVGRWENRPGHFNDVWGYWSDDGLGLFEYLQLAEDIDSVPIWVFNNGLSHTTEVDTKTLGPFIKVCVERPPFPGCF
jgi:alpha-N-arabinofuranosidase